MSEIETKILNVLENDTKEKLYSWEDIMTMFDGYSHFDKCQLKYVYHYLNKHEEKAKYYLGLCLENHNKIMKESLKMKATELPLDDEKKVIEI
jgi:hypothetical protein